VCGALRRWGWLIAVASLAWCGWLVFDALPQIGTALRHTSALGLASAVLTTTAGAWLVFEGWRELAASVTRVRLDRRTAAHIYFTGQILKYLPGRVWGFGYQAVAGARIAPTSDWLLATSMHFGLAILVLLVSAAVVIVAARSPLLASFALVAGIAAYAGAWLLVESPVAHRLVTMASHRRMTALRAAWPRLQATSGTTRLRTGLLLTAGTAAGLAAWIPLCSAGPWGLPQDDALLLAAIYGLAWLVGYLAVFTPAGLGVRELVFISLAPDVGPDVVATLAVLGRANLLLALTFTWFRPSA
jgi:glycosyltransferase 2 family protein